MDYNIVGQTYGRLTITEVTGVRNSRYEMIVRGVCACGKQWEGSFPKLKSGNTRSCGCLQRDIASANRSGVTHGDCKTSTYSTYRSMLRRCYDKNNISYPNYGAKGVTICERWLGENGYANFKEDMGVRPEGATIDRHPDNKGNYEPENCRWATPKEQARNFRSNHWITVNGVTLVLTDWAHIIGVAPTTILDRLKRGWSEEDAVTIPAKLVENKYLVDGEYLTRREISLKYGISGKLFANRVYNGWSVERALIPPRKKLN